jgi:histidine triad (HIT) family protein
MDCIFCKIIAGEIPSDIIYQDDEFIAFRDIQPQAPVHVLVIPRDHISTVMDLTDSQTSLIGRMVLLAKSLAEKEHIAQKGYRIVINCGTEGGQIVPHLHLHLIGGRKLNDQIG